MDLSQDFKEFIELLNKHNVNYMVVGGYSVAYHGYVRYTGDIDIWVKPDQQNAKRIISTLTDFGFGTLDLLEEDFTQAEKVVQFGVVPLRIDVLTSVSGLPDFDDVRKRAVVMQAKDLAIPMINYTDLITNKKHSDRPKDRLDILELAEIKKREKGKN